MRSYLNELDRTGDLVHIRREASPKHEIAAVSHKLEGKAILFEKVRGVEDYRVAIGICSSRNLLARAIGVPEESLLARVLESIERPRPFRTLETGSCQEVVEEAVDLTKIPVLTHCERDGGPYTTASIIIAKDKEYGFNASFHRLMVIGKDRVVARILPRHLDEFIRRGNREVGISIGNHPAFLFASAVSCELGKSELAIANGLREMSFVKCTTNESLVPAECELVLEGVITDELVDEGPFPDITGAYDIVRKQRVVRVNRVTHRRNPIYEAILPGGSEHQLLMGMPREATMFREVSKVCKCIDVRLTPGGSSWLHAAIRIKKESEDDPRNALAAAFNGHLSLKHAIVVDEDINLDEPNAVEWALATRAQMDRDLTLRPNEYGSSLDPSADQVTRKTCKAGIDATIPLNASRDPFEMSRIPHEDSIRLEDYL